MENKLCPHCGKEMIVTRDGSALNYECKYCGYGEATTIADGIEWDATDYHMSIIAIESPNMDQVKIISKLTGKNFVESKRSLIKGDIVFKGLALEIKDIKESLENNNVQFAISPKYPY